MNKKIVFGIILFCAISFIAYTFANPAEQEQGNLGGSNGTTVGGNENSGNPTEPDDNENELPGENTEKPDEDDDTDSEPSTPNGPIAETIDVNKISVSQTSYTLSRGETVQINASVSPANATNKNLTYKSNNVSIATVNSNGVVTARAAGGTTIIITSSNGKTARVTINVKSNGSSSSVVEATGVEVSAVNNDALVKGKTMQINVSVLPSNATDKNVTFKSSNTNVVTVDSNGVVTAKGAGTATITVTTSNGKTKEITVTVIDNKVSTVTVESGRNNTVVTDAKQNGSTIKVYGTADASYKSAYEILVKISVPTGFTDKMLSNVKYQINSNGYSTPATKLEGISKGATYITMPVVFKASAIEALKGNLTISVDWVGSGNPITYSLDLSGITIINN